MFLAGIHISFTFLTEDGVTTFYIGGVYEKNLNTGGVTKYYTFGGERVAMRDSSGVKYFHSDHLGSAALTTDSVTFLQICVTGFSLLSTFLGEYQGGTPDIIRNWSMLYNPVPMQPDIDDCERSKTSENFS